MLLNYKRLNPVVEIVHIKQPEKPPVIVYRTHIIEKLIAQPRPHIKGLEERPVHDSIEFEYIIQEVSKLLRIEKEKILSKQRYREIVIARHFCMYFMYKCTNMTLTAIGKVFGRDHTTVMAALETVSDRVQTDERFAADFEFFQKLFIHGKEKDFVPVRKIKG